MYLEQRW